MFKKFRIISELVDKNGWEKYNGNESLNGNKLRIPFDSPNQWREHNEN